MLAFAILASHVKAAPELKTKPIAEETELVNPEASYISGLKAGDLGMIEQFALTLGTKPIGSQREKRETPKMSLEAAKQRALDFQYHSVDDDQDGFPDPISQAPVSSHTFINLPRPAVLSIANDTC